MFLSRILASWTNSAIQVLDSSSPSLKDNLNGNADVVRRLLDYVYTHWEHPLDALRHQTKIIFRNIKQFIHKISTNKKDLKQDILIRILYQVILYETALKNTVLLKSFSLKKPQLCHL